MLRCFSQREGGGGFLAVCICERARASITNNAYAIKIALNCCEVIDLCVVLYFKSLHLF